jgi:hypothetical protein
LLARGLKSLNSEKYSKLPGPKKNLRMRVGAVTERLPFRELNPLPPSARTTSVCPGLRGLAGVVSTTETLTVRWVERNAIVAKLLDVISEQPMLGRGLGAAVPILDPLAPEAGVDEHLLTPSLMLVGMVDRICPFRLHADCSPVRPRHQGSEHLDPRHSPLLPLIAMDRFGIIASRSDSK